MLDIRNSREHPNAYFWYADHVNSALVDLRLRAKTLEDHISSPSTATSLHTVVVSTRRFIDSCRRLESTVRLLSTFETNSAFEAITSRAPLRHTAWAGKAADFSTARTRVAARLFRHGFRGPGKVNAPKNISVHMNGGISPDRAAAGLGIPPGRVVPKPPNQGPVPGNGAVERMNVPGQGVFVGTNGWSEGGREDGFLSLRSVLLDEKRAKKCCNREGLLLWAEKQSRVLVQPCAVCMRANVPRMGRDAPPVLRDYANFTPIHADCSRSLLPDKYK